MSRFSEVLGIYPLKEGVEIDSETHDARIGAIAAGAWLCMRAGLSPDEFLKLDAEERVIFAAVGDKLRARQAVAIAQACKSVMGQAAVMAVIDDGDQLVKLHLTSLLDRLERPQ